MSRYKGVGMLIGWGLVVFLTMLPTAVLAYDPLKEACGGAGSSSAVCKNPTSAKNPLTGTNGTITRVANVVALFGGVAAIFVLVISGIRYATSSGEAQDISQAKKGIIAALIGLVVITIARLLVSIVIRGAS